MIERIENLSSLVNLKVLNLQFNRIRVLEGMDSLVSLEQLYLSYNSIRSVRQKLQLVPNLRILHLAYNELTIDHLSALTSAVQLTILSLHGNPITKQISYHTLLGLVFSKLVVLDEKEVRRVDVDIMTQQVTFMRSALNEVIKQKNELLVEAQKMKKELTEQADTREQGNKKDQQIQEKMFYIENLAQQNRILKAKIMQAEVSANQVRSRQRSHQQSIRVGQHLQQQAILQQLSIELQRKYAQTLELERRLERMVDSTGPQKQKVLRQLIQNQTIINNCHEQSKKYFKAVEAIRQLSMEEADAQSKSEDEVEEIFSMETQLKKYRQKFQENNFLIHKYRQSLRQSRTLDSQYQHAIFGCEPEQIDENAISNILKKYPNGLLPTIMELLALTFGKYVQIQTIQELRRKLKGTPLVRLAAEFATQPKKSRFEQKQKKYLQQKEEFIREFERETKQLAEQWAALEYQKKTTQEQLSVLQEEFYEDLQSKKKFQQERFARQQQRFQELEQQHQKSISILMNKQLHQKKEIQDLQRQLEEIKIQFDSKFEELQEFEKYFEQIKAEKDNLNEYHIQIERTKSQLEKLMNYIQQRENCIKDLETQQELLKDRADILESKAKDRLNTLLQVNQKVKETELKFSKVIAEHNQLTQQITIQQNTIRVLNDQVKDYQRNVQRARQNFSSWEQKIANLQALQLSSRATRSQLEIQIAKYQQILKNRSKVNGELLIQKERLTQELNHYQLKLAQSRVSLDSLTNLNNAISKMSLHHKELKTNLMELQIQIQSRIKEKTSLQHTIRDLRQDENNLLSRLHSLNVV